MQSESTDKPRDPRALNAYKHDLTGQVHILSAADQAAYDKHCRATHERFNPDDDFEAGLVQSIADGRWQVQRAGAIEDAIFAEAIRQLPVACDCPEIDLALSKGQTWLANQKSLERLTLYVSRIQRRVERDMATLRQLQADRKAAFEKALDDAATLLQLAEEKGETIDLATDFPPELLPQNFDFSDPQIARRLIHHRRLKTASRAAKTPATRAKNAA